MLDEQSVRWNARNTPHKPDEHNPPTPTQRRKCSIKQITPHRVETDINAGVIGEGHDALCEGLCDVIDQGVGAALLRYGEFLYGTGPGNDACAHRLADFHRRETYPSGGAQDEECFARSEAPLPAQGHMAGDIGNRKGASFLKTHAVWYSKCFILSGNGLLSKSAIGENRHGPVSGPETRHAGATLHHHPSRFQPWTERQRRPRLIAPG